MELILFLEIQVWNFSVRCFLSYVAQFVEIKMIFLETHLGEMSRKEFGHSESANAVRTENLSRLLVGGEILFVFGVSEVVFLEVSPQEFNAFGTAGLVFADNGSEISAQLHWLGKSSSFRHFEFLLDSALTASKSASPMYSA